jgi:hypothetical protein
VSNILDIAYLMHNLATIPIMPEKPNRRERRATKFGDPKANPIPQISEGARPKTAFLAWIRGGGISAILLGGFGLMKTFYLPSVIAIYVGLSLLSIDALYEKLQVFLKACIIICLLGIGALFTRAVVLHKSPMQYEYRVIGSDELEMSIRNDSLEDDYTDLDVLVSPSQKESLRYVRDVQIVSGDHSCDLVKFPNEIPNGHMSLVYSPDGKSLVSWSDSFRIRCDKVPHSSTIWLHVKIVTAASSREGMPIPANPIGVPYVSGTFTAKFRTEKVNTKFTVY